MHILRIILLTVAMGASLFVGWRVTENARDASVAGVRGPTPATLHTASGPFMAARDAIAKTLSQSPEFAAYYASLEKNYPSDHARILDTFAERAVKSGRTETPDYYLTQAMRLLRHGRGIAATKASTPTLQHIFDEQLEAVRAMEAADPRICAEFLHGDATDGFFEFSQANRALIARLAQATLDAMLDGQQRKIDRDTPDDADLTALEGALQTNGLDKLQIEALLDAKTPDPPLSDSSMCQAGRVYLETLSTLPQDIKMRLYVLALSLQART